MRPADPTAVLLGGTLAIVGFTGIVLADDVVTALFLLAVMVAGWLIVAVQLFR